MILHSSCRFGGVALHKSAGRKRGQRKGAASKNVKSRQKTSKIFSTLFAQARKKSTKINFLGSEPGGLPRPRKFVFLGFQREESEMSREFGRDVPDPWAVQKFVQKKFVRILRSILAQGKKRQNSSKSFSRLCDIFCAGQKRQKAKKCQKHISRHFLLQFSRCTNFPALFGGLWIKGVGVGTSVEILLPLLSVQRTIEPPSFTTMWRRGEEVGEKKDRRRRRGRSGGKRRKGTMEGRRSSGEKRGKAEEERNQESQIDSRPRYFWKVSRYTSHFYRDTFAKVCPLLGRK